MKHKYITLVDHLTGYKKAFTYLTNKGENKQEAIARAVAQGMQQEQVFCIIVAKKAAGNKCLPIFRIYKDGSMDDLVKTDWNGWGKHYHDVPADFEA